MIPTLRTIVAALAALGLRASAADHPPTAVHLSPEEITEATRTDELSIPMPGEFMASLDKLGKIDWTTLFRPPIATNFTSRPQLDLNLGGHIADGYIAIEAEDAPQVKSIGKDILALAKTLGVSKDVIERGASITGFADQKLWDQLKEELEATQNEVKNGMADQKDADLVTLVTVGGWIRANEAMSAYLAKNYTPAGARLLRQPGIAAMLNSRLGKLSEKNQEDPTVITVRKRMAEIEQLISFPLATVPSQNTVSQLSSLTAQTIKEITKKQTK